MDDYHEDYDDGREESYDEQIEELRAEIEELRDELQDARNNVSSSSGCGCLSAIIVCSIMLTLYHYGLYSKWWHAIENLF